MLLYVVVLFGLFSQYHAQPGFADPTRAENLLTGLMGGDPPPDGGFVPGPDSGFVPDMRMVPGPDPSPMSSDTMPSFSLPDLDRMYDGMLKNIVYDYSGRPVTDPSAQPILSFGYIESERNRLRSAGGGFGPRPTTGDFPSQPMSGDVPPIDGGTGGGFGPRPTQGDFPSQPMSGDIPPVDGGAGDFPSQPMSGDIPPVDGGAGSSGSTITIEFTKPEVERMLAGMDVNRTTYDFDGKETNATTNVLTRQQLDLLMAQFQPEGPRMSRPFSLSKVQQMIVGMEAAERYNYDGMMAAPGEPELTMAQLVYLHQQLQLQPQDSEMAASMYSRPGFTLTDIDDMIRGSDSANFYNYEGRPAQVGDPVLTMPQLLLLQQEYQPGMVDTQPPSAGGQGSSSGGLTDSAITDPRIVTGAGEPTPDMTSGPVDTVAPNIPEPAIRVNPVDSGSSGTNMGGGGTDHGMSSSNVGPTDPGMVAPLDPGMVAPSDTVMTGPNVGVIDPGMSQPDIGPRMSRPFSLSKVQQMIVGMEAAERYNYDGMMAAPGEPELTMAQLVYLHQQLQSRPEGSEMAVSMYSRAGFTLTEIDDMIRGSDSANFYNYEGRPAQVGDPVLTMPQLLLLQQEYQPGMVDTQPPSAGGQGSSSGGLTDPAITDPRIVTGAGEPTPDMTSGPVDTVAPNIPEPTIRVTPVDSGSSGTNMGGVGTDPGMSSSNVGPTDPGMVAPSDTVMTDPNVGVIDPGMSQPDIGPRMSRAFSLSKVQQMIVGMEAAERYNYDGMMAAPGEPELTMAQLVYLHQQLQSRPEGSEMAVSMYSRAGFTLTDIDDMIRGSDSANFYNYEGRPAQVGDPVLTMPQLLLLQQEYQPGMVDTQPPSAGGQGASSRGLTDLTISDPRILTDAGEPTPAMGSGTVDTVAPNIPEPAIRVTSVDSGSSGTNMGGGGTGPGMSGSNVGPRDPGVEGPTDHGMTDVGVIDPVMPQPDIGAIDSGMPSTDGGVIDPVMPQPDIGVIDPVMPQPDIGVIDPVMPQPDFGVIDPVMPQPDGGVIDPGMPKHDSGVIDSGMTQPDIGVIDSGMPQPDIGTTRIDLPALPDTMVPSVDPSGPGPVDSFVPTIDTNVPGPNLGPVDTFVPNVPSFDLNVPGPDPGPDRSPVDTFVPSVESNVPNTGANIPVDTFIPPNTGNNIPVDTNVIVPDPSVPSLVIPDMSGGRDPPRSDVVSPGLDVNMAITDQGAPTIMDSGRPSDRIPTVSNVVDINPLATGGADRNQQLLSGPVNPMFTIDQVQNMLNGMRNGMIYNYDGYEATTGDTRLISQLYLENLLQRLQTLVQPDWMQARLDPAPCREYNCNLPICYVPYKKDCKSYVVCQRTALGTYVAWKMRCAFGSYWGTRNMWTCERVEDLADMGFMCPNDKCRNPNIDTYPDEEERNCRTYWRCENGMSRPACCPPGQMFDRLTLRCENDPLEKCRSPCPLRIEGCANNLTKTQPFYDGNCRTYWDCAKGNPHPVCCPARETYDTITGKCNKDSSCRHACPTQYAENICARIAPSGTKQVTSYTLDDENCRTFMKCFGSDYGERWCCRQQYRYDTTTARCEPVTDYLDPCNQARCPVNYKEECPFKAHPTNPKMFIDRESEMPQKCANGTAFDESICTCGKSIGVIPVHRCKKEVHTKFDDPENQWHVKNYGDGWISVYGKMLKNVTTRNVTYGSFNGNNGMEVWRYDHTAFPQVTLKIVFQPNSVQIPGMDEQTVVSNCKSVDGINPSFEVSVVRSKSQVLFRGQTASGTAELAVPYNHTAWNTYQLLFDGQTVIAMIEDPATGRSDSSSTQLNGEILAGVGSLKFGPCVGERNGFVGYISEVIFSKCLDIINQRQMMDVMRNQSVP